MKILRIIFSFQALYYLTTGLWPLLHIGSFMAVTGPKDDTWLVNMVGLLAAAIGLALLFGQQEITRQTIVLSIGSALAFIAIDLHYALTGVISKIYLADAAVQAVLIIVVLISRLQSDG